MSINKINVRCNVKKIVNNVQIAYKYIRDAIFSGEIKPGSSVTEKWLGEYLNMSRTPVREAMIRLQYEGLLTVINNRATVTTISPVDIQEIFQLRLLLEPQAASICVHRIEKEKMMEIRRFTGGLLERKSQTYSSDIHDLHKVIIESTKNKRWITVSNYLQNQIIRLLNMSEHIPGRITRSLEEHLLIIDAIIAGDSLMAESHMRSHIESNMNDMLDAANFHFIFKE